MTDQSIQQKAICYQWFKQQLILSVSKPTISQRSQIKGDTVEPSMPAWEFNLKAYTTITWHNDPACLGLEPRLANHRSQAAHTARLPTAPPRHRFTMPDSCSLLCDVSVVYSDFRAYKPARSGTAAARHVSEGGWRWRLGIDWCKEHRHHGHSFLSQSRSPWRSGLFSINVSSIDVSYVIEEYLTSFQMLTV